MPLIAAIDRLLALAERVCRFLAGACLVFMLGANFANILLRTATKTSLVFVPPWTTVVFIWMSFLGFYSLYRLSRDIRVDLLVRLFARGSRAWDVVINLVVALLMAILLWQWPTSIASQAGTVPMVGLERYHLTIPLFVSSGLILANALLEILRGPRAPADDGVVLQGMAAEG